MRVPGSVTVAACPRSWSKRVDGWCGCAAAPRLRRSPVSPRTRAAAAAKSWSRGIRSRRARWSRSTGVYQRKGTGLWWHLAIAGDAALGVLAPGRIGIVDAPDAWPWPSGGVAPGPRCYTVTAVSTGGLEGPMSAEACGAPIGGP